MNPVSFFREVYADNHLRPPAQRRRLSADLPLFARNVALLPAEAALQRAYGTRPQTVVFLVGVPRSGTTLAYQLIARHLAVGYVNNRMARHWMVPVAGARLHATPLTDGRDIALTSTLGGTEGRDAPHEFGWFWQYHTGFTGSDEQGPEALAAVDVARLRRALWGMARACGAPLVLKNVNYVDYQIAWLKAAVPTAKFLWVRRDPVAAALSILRAREERYGDASRWWAVRPADFRAWATERPERQVAHQICHIEAAIERAFAGLGTEDAATLHYEALTAAPGAELRRLAAFVGVRTLADDALAGLTLKAPQTGARTEGDGALRARVEAALRSMESAPAR